MITKFSKRFANDKTFQDLCATVENGNAQEAFRMAHTLKGICSNLGFDRCISAEIQKCRLIGTAERNLNAVRFRCKDSELKPQDRQGQTAFQNVVFYFTENIEKYPYPAIRVFLSETLFF